MAMTNGPKQYHVMVQQCGAGHGYSCSMSAEHITAGAGILKWSYNVILFLCVYHLNQKAKFETEVGMSLMPKWPEEPKWDGGGGVHAKQELLGVPCPGTHPGENYMCVKFSLKMNHCTCTVIKGKPKQA